MFENVNSSAGNSGPAGAGGSVSSMKPPVPQAPGNNLPSSPAGGAANGVEDIFSQMDGGNKPARPAALAPKGTLPPNPAITAGAEGGFKKDMDMKKLIIAVIGLVGLILIFLGLWYSYNIFLPSRQETKTQTPAGQEPQPAAQNNEVKNQENATSTGADSAANETISPDALTGIDIIGEQTGLDNLADNNGRSTTVEVGGANGADATLDTDGDGLTDVQERQLGTDINKMDSDSDGLFDGEEVNTYKTDPLNADTDGDGFQDGSEVKNGYNPKGAGKLYEVTPQ